MQASAIRPIKRQPSGHLADKRGVQIRSRDRRIFYSPSEADVKNAQPGLEPSVLATEAAVQGNLNGGFLFGHNKLEGR
jgi:hypothetical protein